jgi:predicted permease
LETIAWVGQPAAPLALMSLGGALVTYRLRDHLTAAIGVAAVKLGVGLALGMAAVWLLGLERPEALALLVMASVPTAVASYVLVSQVGGDRALAASCIAATTLGAVVSLGGALLIVELWYGGGV